MNILTFHASSLLVLTRVKQFWARAISYSSWAYHSIPNMAWLSVKGFASRHAFGRERCFTSRYCQHFLHKQNVCNRDAPGCD